MMVYTVFLKRNHLSKREIHVVFIKITKNGEASKRHGAAKRFNSMSSTPEKTDESC